MRVRGRPDDEAELVAALQQGSEEAAEALVLRHWAAAHRTAYLILFDAAAAEDVCQEAMLAAIDAVGRFDRRRPFRPWLHRIVVNRALDATRARARRPEATAEDALATQPARAEPALTTALADALAALSSTDRAIVVLRHLFDYNSREIARMVDLPAATVRTRLRRALEQLRAALERGE